MQEFDDFQFNTTVCKYEDCLRCPAITSQQMDQDLVESLECALVDEPDVACVLSGNAFIDDNGHIFSLNRKQIIEI